MNRLTTSIIATAAAAAVAFSSCSDSNRKQQKEHEADFTTFPQTVKIDISEAIDMDKVFEHKGLVSFEENTENIIGSLHNIVVRGDTIFAIDPYKNPGIYAYLKYGRQLFAYCSVGNGPGDLIAPTCISVTDDEVSTYDGAQFKIIVIGKDGKYRRSIDVPPMTLNAILDTEGNVWADFSNQDLADERIMWKAPDDTAYSTVMEVPDLLKGMTLIVMEALQNLPDGTVGYTPAMEPRIYTLADGKIAERYNLDFNGLWPDDETFKTEFTGNAWAPKSNYFPVKSLRYNESDRYLVIRFINDNMTYLYILDKASGRAKIVRVNTDLYWGCVFVNDDEIYMSRKDDCLEIMTINSL